MPRKSNSPFVKPTKFYGGGDGTQSVDGILAHADLKDENTIHPDEADNSDMIARLTRIGDVGPPRGAVIVVPGNHDLTARAEDQERDQFNVGDQVIDLVTGQAGTVVAIGSAEIAAGEPQDTADGDIRDYLAEQAWNDRQAERFYEADLKRAVAQHRSTSVLDNLSLVLPNRIATEVLGDYLERIEFLARSGASHRTIYSVMIAGLFWTITNAVGHFVQQVLGRKTA